MLINQVDWFNYLTLLQWKVSNHEVSPLYITPFGFCCVHRNWSHQTSVWSCGMPLIYRYKASAFQFSCMHWQRVLFRKAWLRDRFSTSLNLVTLLRCCSGLWLLGHFLSSIQEYFWMYQNSKCLMWQLQIIFFWWLVLACNAFYISWPYNCIAHIAFYTQSKILLLIIMHCSLYTISSFVLGRSAA